MRGAIKDGGGYGGERPFSGEGRETSSSRGEGEG